MNKKALLAAALAGLAGAGLLYVYMQRFEAEASGGPPVAVLMATQDIPLGTVITKDMIGVRNLPAAYVEDRHIRAADAQRIIGVRVSNTIRANESILWGDLATSTEENRSLSGMVLQSFRAITIRADATSTFGGLLRPGDRVDVLLTTGQENDKDRVTVPLLQNVLVLAVGEDIGAEEIGGSQRQHGRQFHQVTLSVTVEQASILTLASHTGVLSLTLRNPDDIVIDSQLPETHQDDILQSDKRSHLLHREQPADAPQVPERVN